MNLPLICIGGSTSWLVVDEAKSPFAAGLVAWSTTTSFSAGLRVSRRIGLLLGLLVSIHALASDATWAGEPPNIERLVPPGGQMGTRAEVTLVGKPGDGQLQIWSATEQLQFKLAEKFDKATVEIPADAKPGIHYLRFYNQHGATDLRPFFVGTFPELSETEPNNQPSEASTVESFPATVNGILEKTGEVDVFAVPLEAGPPVTLLVQANRELGSPMDGVLELLNPDGSRIASCDDDQGNDPRLNVVPATSGTYFVRLFAFPASPNSSIRLAGSKAYQYRLSIGPADFDLPKLDSFAAATEDSIGEETLTVPWSSSGRIGQAGETDEYFFEAVKGENVTIRVAARRHGSLLDPLAVLIGPGGKTIKEFDDISRSDPDVEFAVTLPADGLYTLTIGDRFDHGGDRYSYVAGVVRNEPSFEATVAGSAFVVGKEKPLEIPVTISRQHGFAGEITVKIDGLPQGLSAEHAVSASEGDTSKAVTLKVERTEDAKPFSGAVQVVCGSQIETPATAPIPHTSLRTDQLWLTVLP